MLLAERPRFTTKEPSRMHWHDELLDQLAAEPICGYRAGGPAATEPTAWAALALATHERFDAARVATEWLARNQIEQGSVGVREHEMVPHWPTGLAVLAWTAVQAREANSEKHYADNIKRAIDWILSYDGKIMPRDPEMGHDTMLAAWPWVVGTHSWIEPTAINTLALKAAGLTKHPRARNAVRMLIDRQLPGGGCNYGNTFVLGQELRPHVQPTGLALLALAGETDASGRLTKSIEYLERSVTSGTTAASLSYALLGLAAHNRFPANAEASLRAAYATVLKRDRSRYKLALIALARSGASSDLFRSLGFQSRANPIDIRSGLESQATAITP